MNDDIKQIIEKELQIGRIPPEAREKALAALGENIMKQIIIDVYQYVPEDGIKEMDKRVEADDVEGLVAYIEANIPQAGVLMQESAKKVVADFKKAFGV